ncbi:Cytochrome c biogenesis factor [Gaiella occulta]|uniref:Cytochrome c biogenesis factor n=1 Tax=Gaiella occulta TaxID=1002870 RepID=A0A7M2YYV8_9ACTN|nr:heme lyase CcmF/NrfE family subunit [Gaiella occulta]RDI74944.1 Cytochrome c biogenesis factor [Gaiella occulta]
MAELGRAALVVTLGLALYALVAGVYAGVARRRRFALSARNALIASFASTLVAFGVLAAGFLRRDFSLTYVADHSNRSLSGIYRLSALWGGQEGSLLLWLLILTGYSALALWINRNRAKDLVVWVTPVLAAITVGFAFLLVVVASPFALQVAPLDGAGLNPSLQNPYMMAHPLFLYLGYVGLSVPFAFAMGALLSGRTDERWIVATRRWTLLAWTTLGLGQLFGAHWAYVEVGWGGYYAWDPVENAALMPWLAATAFLHSVMIQEKRGMLKVWNVVLVSLAFCLSLFGTFITRSGVITSVHSFAQSDIGPWFLAFIIIAVAFSVAMIMWRLPLLRSTTRLESLVSREAVFLYNNLLLVALCLTILWGVAWPLLSEAVRGQSVVVGRPYFDFFLRIFGLPLLLLMGIGPLIAWRRASVRGVLRTFTWPGAIAVGTGVVLLFLGAGSSIPGLVAYTFSAFVLAAIGLEFVRGTRARRALSRESWPVALASLLSHNRRRYGGYVVHAAIVLLAIGIAGSSAYDSVSEGRLSRGQALSVGGYTVTYQGLKERDTDHATEVRAQLAVQRDGKSLGLLEAGKNSYKVAGPDPQVSSEVGVRSDYSTGEDLFVIAEQINSDGSVYFRIFVKPLVNLIWLAGIVFVLGSLVALWPDAREERRLVLRYELAGSPVRGR